MWLVIGYGSTLHADDGFGPAVVEGVRARLPCGVPLEVIAGIQPVPEWAEPISRASGVIFVDASADLPPGQLQCVALTDEAPRASTFTHHCTPQALLESAGLLYGHRPPGWLYAAGGANFTLGEALSAPVAAAVPRAVAAILKIVTEDAQRGPCMSSVSSRESSPALARD
jgi:hydrogenase maturation protease